MKKMKRIAVIILSCLMSISFMPIGVFAATVTQDNVETEVTTDKEKYSAGESILVTVDILNNSNYEITSVMIDTTVPKGFYLKEDVQNKIASLKSGEKETTSMELLADSEDETLKNNSSKNEISEDNSSNAESSNNIESNSVQETNVNTTEVNAVSQTGNPLDTGDYANTLLYVGTCCISGTLLVSLWIVKKKNRKKLLSILLCVTLMGGLVYGLPVKASSEKNAKSMSVTENVKVDGKDVSITVTIDYDMDNEVLDPEQLVPEDVAALFGVDPNAYDTDKDGLSNYIEIYTSQTNPTITDTDGDGVFDADEDFDGDGISNIKEIELGTDLDKADSDKDGLNDYDEINTYKTDPTAYDSDGDSLGDGDEVILGLDPLLVKTDGVTIDSERKFTQELSENNISEQLLVENNQAIPSLELTTSGNINKNVVVNETSSTDFSDSRAVVGDAIDISGENISEGTLTFSLNDGSISMFSLEDSEQLFNTNIICKYNEDGTTEFLDTHYDSGTNSVSANIENEGTYFVLDVETLFNELGLRLPDVSNVNALTDPEPAMVLSVEETEEDIISQYSVSDEETVSTANELTDACVVSADANVEKTITRTASGAMAQADIVFVVDTTGSMKEEIDNVKENVGFFVDALKANGVSADLALVNYEDIGFDGYDSTKVHKNGTSNWFYDMETYKSKISGLELGCGGDVAESAVDALETARLLDMRASAGKIFILVTDAAYKVENRYGIPSMAAEIELLKNAGINCTVVSPKNKQSTYYDLYNETEGIWVNINGDFYSDLMTLADKIGTDIAGDGYWIYLQGPVPVPVRLDAVPQEGSKVDTDKDGIPDIEELESATPTGSIDLDALITKISDGVITGTNYGTVMMYKYNSNPGEKDTDFDGTDDSLDAAPNDSHGSGVMHYSVDETSYTCNVEFNMDYRQLINGDNELYSRDLSMLSVLFATDVYDHSYIQVTDFAKIGGSDIGINFGNILGLEDSQYINIIGADYAVDQDDITDFYVGHKNIIYNGEAHEVIVVSVRGTNGTHEEWSSNFDIGADTAEYYAATGLSHPDWKNKENHKGFDVAANRVLVKLNEYIEEYVSPYAQKSILITGHSRGAAIANILGKHFEEDDSYRSYTYTFATPSTTTAANAGDYTTIFNVLNTDDIITFIPLESWGFTKYGESKAVCVEDYYENELGAEEEGCWEWFIGQDYNNDGGTESTLSSFAKIASNREDMYVLGETDSEKVWEDDLGHTTRAGAEEELASLSQTLTNEKLRKFCDMYIVYSYLIYHVEINYCPAYLLQTLANMTTGVGPLLGRDVAGVYADAKTAFVASSGKVVIGGMTHPHMPPTYYIMAYHDLKSLY